MIIAARATVIVLLAAMIPMIHEARAEPLNLTLPTENDTLFRGGGADFYQYIIRDFKGVITRPWQGGQYGFVRNPVETSSGLLYTRFHEGVDIKPVRRDARGEPLDEVRAIADGTVVHVNLVPGYSNYGKYVVVDHVWDGARYYSLYGHLASAAVTAGAKVDRGERLGILGYTGSGLDQARAHVHLELNLMLSRNFEPWHKEHFKTEPNRHGLYNGINLTGIDIAGLYKALRKRPSLTVPEFLEQEETFYKVTLPASADFDLPRRYPWLMRTATDSAAPSWVVSFNRSGVPLEVVAADAAVDAPTLSYVKKSGTPYAGLTRGVIGGSGANAHLSESGKRLMRLLIYPE